VAGISAGPAETALSLSAELRSLRPEGQSSVIVLHHGASSRPQSTASPVNSPDPSQQPNRHKTSP
jgi:hypothetical protein